MPKELILKQDLPPAPTPDTQALVQHLMARSSLHGMFAQTLENVGGQQFIDEWARNNPTTFMDTMLRLVPPPAPQGSGGGGGNHVTLVLPPTLQAGPLDGPLVFDNDG